MEALQLEDGSHMRFEVVSSHELGQIEVQGGPDSTKFVVQTPVVVRETPGENDWFNVHEGTERV